MPGTSPASSRGAKPLSEKDSGYAKQTAHNPAGIHPETNNQAADSPTGYQPPSDPSSSSGSQTRVPVPARQETQGSQPQQAGTRNGDSSFANPTLAKEIFGPVLEALAKAAAAADSEGASRHAEQLRAWKAQVDQWAGKAKL